MTFPVKINMIIKFHQINPIRRLVLINFILVALNPFFCNSQNLYNMEQSQKYAEYLFSSRQHILAAEEYERLIYFDENNVSYKYKLIKSYRLSGNLNSGINRIYSFYGNSLNTMPQSLATEFFKMQLLTDSLSVAEKFIQQSNTLSSENKTIFQCYSLLLKGDYNEAGMYVKKAADNDFIFPSNILILTGKAEKTKFKSPFLAAGFSAIIPGTGKFYTKNWSDGIVSMLFIAGNAWQAYRGFSEHGIKSGYGWVFTGISASFYIGNIFGSAKAANRYNKNKKNEIDNQIFESVRSDSF
jgi:tetratricopeptide (TPR) repeat protein